MPNSVTCGQAFFPELRPTGRTDRRNEKSYLAVAFLLQLGGDGGIPIACADYYVNNNANPSVSLVLPLLIPYKIATSTR